MKKIPVFPAIFILTFLVLSSSAQALCVKVSTANLRTGPGTSYKVAWQVYMYMPLEKVGKVRKQKLVCRQGFRWRYFLDPQEPRDR